MLQEYAKIIDGKGSRATNDDDRQMYEREYVEATTLAQMFQTAGDEHAFSYLAW